MNDIMHPKNINQWATASVQMVLIHALVGAARAVAENEEQLAAFRQRHESKEKHNGTTHTPRSEGPSTPRGDEVGEW